MFYLERVKRPVVEFDPADVTHRALYQQFMKTNRWDHSPIMFDLPENYLELPYYLNMRLTEYYMSQDKKLQNLVDNSLD